MIPGNPGSDLENPEVWDITFGNGKIFAATGTGVFSAGLSDPGLSYFGNWNKDVFFRSLLRKYTAADLFRQ